MHARSAATNSSRGFPLLWNMVTTAERMPREIMVARAAAVSVEIDPCMLKAGVRFITFSSRWTSVAINTVLLRHTLRLRSR